MAESITLYSPDTSGMYNMCDSYIIYQSYIINSTRHDARTDSASANVTTDVCVCLLCTYITLKSKLHDTIKCWDVFRYVHMSSY